MKNKVIKILTIILFLTLIVFLLTNKAVGIGDHSTGDFFKNAEEALQMLVDSDDKLEAIKKYYGI